MNVFKRTLLVVLLSLAGCGGSNGNGNDGGGGSGGSGGGSGGDMAAGASGDFAVAGGDMTSGGDMTQSGDLTMFTCGGASATFTLLTGADAGLVKDNATGLVWMHDSVGAGEPPQTQMLAMQYCTGRHMRLPTKDEALALAAKYAACAFGHWQTWTSTAPAIAGDAWVVDYTGGASPQVANNFPSAVLCVR